MPSPFPGMDPYLEDPDIYPDFHDRFVTYLSELAQPALPDPYLSGIGRRAWIDVSERYVEVFRSPRAAAGDSGGGTAVATGTASEPIVVHVPHDERRQPFVEIYIGRRNDRRLVTVIELLSRTNKSPGEHGRDLYVRKQREILYSKVNLVEIDLLRTGLHTTAVPESRLRRKAPRFDYHVCIHRFDNLEDFLVHAVQLEEPLPTIQVPLLPEDGSVAINLQAVFDRCYDAGPYSREIDYDHDQPEPPLTAEQSTWFRELMKLGSS